MPALVRPCNKQKYLYKYSPRRDFSPFSHIHHVLAFWVFFVDNWNIFPFPILFFPFSIIIKPLFSARTCKFYKDTAHAAITFYLSEFLFKHAFTHDSILTLLSDPLFFCSIIDCGHFQVQKGEHFHGKPCHICASVADKDHPGAKSKQRHVNSQPSIHLTVWEILTGHPSQHFTSLILKAHPPIHLTSWWMLRVFCCLSC